jgi:hypothetical protein
MTWLTKLWVKKRAAFFFRRMKLGGIAFNLKNHEKRIGILAFDDIFNIDFVTLFGWGKKLPVLCPLPFRLEDNQ